MNVLYLPIELAMDMLNLTTGELPLVESLEVLAQLGMPVAKPRERIRGWTPENTPNKHS